VSAIFGDGIILWSAVLIVVLPALIIVAGEFQERLRQRGSALERPVATLRNWVLPLATAWTVAVEVLGADSGNFFVRVIATGALLALTAAALQTIQYFVDKARDRSSLPGVGQIPQLALMLPRLIVLIVAGWFLITNVWNVDLTGLLAALGVTSLIISLALQPTLSGLASGLLLLADRPFKPGDWVLIDEIEGTVVDVSWRTTRVQDRNGDVIVFPNSHLSEATIVNYAEPARLHRVVVSLTVAYHNPPTRAVDMLLAAARATEGVLEDPPPVVRVTTIDDPLMGYDVQMWIDDHTITPRVKSDFGALVWYQSHRMGVPLPSPAFDLYHHDPIQEAADAKLTPEELALRIRHAPVLSGLGDDDIAELAAASRQVRYRAGETILAPGVVDRDTFVLWEGRVRIVSSAEPSRFIDLGAGDIFGVMSGATRSEDPPAVVALTDCEVVVVEGDVVGAVASRDPELMNAWDKITTIRSRRVMPSLYQERKSADERASSPDLPHETLDRDGDGGEPSA
jgi:small-conductance mechanosensitive channel